MLEPTSLTVTDFLAEVQAIAGPPVARTRGAVFFPHSLSVVSSVPYTNIVVTDSVCVRLNYACQATIYLDDPNSLRAEVLEYLGARRTIIDRFCFPEGSSKFWVFSQFFERCLRTSFAPTSELQPVFLRSVLNQLRTESSHAEPWVKHEADFLFKIGAENSKARDDRELASLAAMFMDFHEKIETGLGCGSYRRPASVDDVAHATVVRPYDAHEAIYVQWLPRHPVAVPYDYRVSTGCVHVREQRWRGYADQHWTTFSCPQLAVDFVLRQERLAESGNQN